MYDYICGRLVKKEPEFLVLDNNGIGYLLHISLNTFQNISSKDNQKIYIHYHHTENDSSLFGFSAEFERDVFRSLINISGIGPKFAVKVLSGISAGDFVNVILSEDKTRLKRVPGLGDKMSQKIIFELAPKFRKKYPASISVTSGQDRSVYNDSKEALKNLGYKDKQVESVLSGLFKKNPDISIEQAIREALAFMGGQNAG